MVLLMLSRVRFLCFTPLYLLIDEDGEINETNRLTLAGANVVADPLQVKRKQRPRKEQNQEPWWKRRIMKQRKELRRDLSRLDQWSRSILKDKDIIEYLERKYHVKANE